MACRISSSGPGSPRELLHGSGHATADFFGLGVHDSRVSPDSRPGLTRQVLQYTLQPPGRRKATSVMPADSANSTASVEGAPMAATTGAPAIMAFCSSSKLARPDSSTTRSRHGKFAGEQRRADQLVHGVVPADVLAAGDQSTVRREQSDRVHAAGLGEAGLRGAQRVGQAAQHRLPNYQSRWQCAGRRRSRSPLRWTPCHRRRSSRWCRNCASPARGPAADRRAP